MKIKTLLTLAAAALSLSAGLAQALTVAPYSAEALAKAQQAGEPVALHFHASWCPTCISQDKALDALKADAKANAELNMTVLQADYDKERDLKKQLKVRTQSTLIVYRGATERARSVGETGAGELKAALQAALKPAQ